MHKFLPLTLNTARDIVRQPVIVMLTVAGIVTMGMLPVVAVFAFGQEERIIRDGAIASCFVYGLFLAVSSSIASISKQIRSGTAESVLAKPVSREIFFCATYCGILLVCLFFTAIAAMAAMLSVRMALAGIYTDWLIGKIFAAAVLLAFAGAAAANYYGQNFYSALFKALFFCLIPALLLASFFDPDGGLVPLAGHSQAGCAYCQGQAIHAGVIGHFGEFIQWQLAPVSLLVFGALAMLSAIAVALSTRFAPAVVFAACCLVFILGLIADYLLLTVAGGSLLARLGAVILPNWQCLWVDEAHAGSGVLTPAYILKACAYAGLYISGVLCLGVLSFKNMDA